MSSYGLVLVALLQVNPVGPGSIPLLDPDTTPTSTARLFGGSVACARYGQPGTGNSGYTMVVGAPGDDDMGENAGEVYLYDTGLLSPGALNLSSLAPVATGDQIGQVALDGGLLAVGAWRADTFMGLQETGVVRVFTHDVATNTWIAERAFDGSDFLAQAFGDRFS